MERVTTRADYIKSIHKLISVNTLWSLTRPKSDERDAAYVAYEQAIGFAQIRSSRLGYLEHQVYTDAAAIREGKDVS